MEIQRQLMCQSSSYDGGWTGVAEATVDGESGLQECWHKLEIRVAKAKDG